MILYLPLGIQFHGSREIKSFSFLMLTANEEITRRLKGGEKIDNKRFKKTKTEMLLCL